MVNSCVFEYSVDKSIETTYRHLINNMEKCMCVVEYHFDAPGWVFNFIVGELYEFNMNNSTYTVYQEYNIALRFDEFEFNNIFSVSRVIKEKLESIL